MDPLRTPSNGAHLGPGRVKREGSTTYTSPFCTAGSAHQPGCAASADSSESVPSEIPALSVRMSTSGAYASTCGGVCKPA
eukprot:4966447-Pyramimonas_sp.AAC.2